jgi:hypothetical protein
MNPRELQQLLLMPEGLRAQYLAALKKPQKMADGGEFGRKAQRINQATSFGDVPMGGNQIVKEMGGNWLGGNVENALVPMQRTVLNDTGVKNLRARQGDEVADAYLQERPRHKAINDWIQGNLTNYVKKQMGTEADPVRKLAEQGITHFPVAEDPTFWTRKGDISRKNMKGKQVAQSPLAQQWENRSDSMIESETAQQHQDMMHLAPKMYTEKDEWIKKASPDTKIHMLSTNAPGNFPGFNAADLGFDHIMDVLKEDLAEGRIRPEQMSKISMEQAVRRVHEYDQDKLKKMKEAQIKNTEGMPVHKVYDDGHKWIELAMNPELPQGFTQEPSGAYVSPTGEKSLHHPNYVKLQDALKYEGETMGHCVGGYCPDVMAGKSRIFSLRDAKGEPHVTIETQPGEGVGPKEFFMNDLAPKSLQNDIFALEREGAFNDPHALEDFIEQSPEYKNYIKSLPPKIEQIKGKGNGKPVAKYIPMVQDFVKAGTWSDIGDLHHTDLIHLDPKSDLAKAIQATGEKPPRYITQQELTDLSKKHNFPGWVNSVQKKADGGSMKPLTKRQFESQFAQHIDLRGRTNKSQKENAKQIMEQGFQSGIGVNAFPPYSGGEPQDIMSRKFKPQAGDTVYLAPKGAWKDTPNGMKIVHGWKPEPHHVVQVEDPNQSMYDAYIANLNQKAQGGSIKPVGYTKEKVTVSPSLDRMQYELMSVKHFKKAK